MLPKYLQHSTSPSIIWRVEGSASEDAILIQQKETADGAGSTSESELSACFSPNRATSEERIPLWVDGPPTFPEQLGFGINAGAFAAMLLRVPLRPLLITPRHRSWRRIY